MNNDTTVPQIFLSYAWKNSSIADEIDNDFKRAGITLSGVVGEAHLIAYKW